MRVRAKLMLTSITESGYGYKAADGQYAVQRGAGKRLVFTASYDPSIPEDRRFAQHTPDGRFEMQVDNPAALAAFEIGRQYYVEMTPVDEVAGT